MHYLHAILVKVDEDQLEKFQAGEIEAEELLGDARADAMDETQCFEGRVFDWRTEEDAGRWAQRYPEGGILGATDPDRFKKELQEWAQKPLKQALEFFWKFMTVDVGWRTEEEIASTPGCQKIPNFDRNMNVDISDGVFRFWSGIMKNPFVLTEEAVKEMWEEKGSFNDFLAIFYLKNIIKHCDGEYRCDSYFYSVYDGSSKISKRTMEECMQHPEQFALIFTDIHY